MQEHSSSFFLSLIYSTNGYDSIPDTEDIVKKERGHNLDKRWQLNKYFFKNMFKNKKYMIYVIESSMEHKFNKGTKLCFVYLWYL